MVFNVTVYRGRIVPFNLPFTVSITLFGSLYISTYMMDINACER